MTIRKAVFPVGGLGTRFLPATKAMPKEMLPIVDKPLIQYAVEEAAAAGIEEFIFVTGKGKTAIEDHFDHHDSLQTQLRSRGKEKDLQLLEPLIFKAGSVFYTRQQEPLGLGHAVLCARHFIGDEPFAVLLADDFMHGPVPCLKQMVEAYTHHPCAMAAVMQVPPAQVNRYGIIGPQEGLGPAPRLIPVASVVEKPTPELAPSTWAILGRYILPPTIFDFLEKQPRGIGGEIQLTDAFTPLLQQGPFYGFQFDGQRFDCGSKSGYVAATVAVSLTREDLRQDILEDLESRRIRVTTDVPA
jgi:UTP--glucose-1-phosphate uridylyltransferase